MKRTLCIALLTTLSFQAQAGLWDSISSFFGGSDNSPATQAVSQPDLAQTGLQLLPLLTQQLGVSSAQAEGGMGALLQAAKILLSQTDYAVLAQAIPNSTNLLAAAPDFSATSKTEPGLLGSALAVASEYSETAKTGKQLISQFQSLGLNADMIPQFTNIASDYLKQTNNAEASGLLTSAFSALL